MMNMKLLAFVTSSYIYHGCSTWKTFWGKKFTGEEKFTLGEFSAVNMKICGRRSVREVWQYVQDYNHIFRAKR